MTSSLLKMVAYILVLVLGFALPAAADDIDTTNVTSISSSQLMVPNRLDFRFVGPERPIILAGSADKMLTSAVVAEQSKRAIDITAIEKTKPSGAKAKNFSVRPEYRMAADKKCWCTVGNVVTCITTFDCDNISGFCGGSC